MAYICLSFSIQTVLLGSQLTRGKLRHALSLPRTLAPSNIWLQPGPLPEFVLEVQLPNTLFGIQIFWELWLRDAQTGQKIRLRYRLRSGHNRIKFPLSEAEPCLLAQFQHGLYRGESQCFYVRDCFATLHMRYRIKQALELAILSPINLPNSSQTLPAKTSQDPLNSTIHKFAQEGFLGEQRPYYPGDDPRHINWKLYSRFNELYVRIPEEQPIFSQDLHCYFVLDMACYPKFLRSSVLDQACTYFLGRLKELHQSGYRIIAHIPGEEQGILYQKSNEEQMLHLLAAYPRNASLSPADGDDNPTILDNNNTQGLQAQMNKQASSQPSLQRLLARHYTGSQTSNLIFASPHSISDPSATLSQYFTPSQAQYIPLPEPSTTLCETLLQKRLTALLPIALLWHWLLLGNERLQKGSKTLQLYRELGLPVTRTACLPSRTKTRTTAITYQPLQAWRYPQLLLRLWAWKRYYREPERRYSVSKARKSDSIFAL